MKINNKFVIMILSISVLFINGCYAYGGKHYNTYHDKPSVELDYRYSSRHGIEYEYRYKNYTPHNRHNRYNRYNRHYRYGRPYGGVEYRNRSRHGTYRRECWDHRYKRHYYC